MKSATGARRPARSAIAPLRRWLLAVAVAAAHAGAAVPDDGIAATGRPLVKLALALSGTDPYQRLDFAAIALEELALAYQSEAEHAWRSEDSRKNPAQLARWAARTSAYAATLYELSARVYEHGDVGLRVDAGVSVRMLLGGRSVVVDGPRLGEPGSFDGRVVARFCDLHDCASLLPMARVASYGLPTEPSAEMPMARAASVEWMLSDRHDPICRSSDGVEFTFYGDGRTGAKRGACALVIGELRALASRIRELREQGVEVDASLLHIRPLATEEGHMVTLNTRGEGTRLRLPALARAGDLLWLSAAWLDGHSRGATARLVIDDADGVLDGVIEMVEASSN